MTNRIVRSKPLLLQEFEDPFLDGEACAEDLFGSRFADGCAYPRCRSSCAKRLDRPRHAHECRGFKQQISVTAGTVMHRPHVQLMGWFRALPLDDGLFQRRFGCGYKAAWLPQKIRRAMHDSGETSGPRRWKPSELPSLCRGPRGRLLSKLLFYRYIADLGKHSGAGP